jgi:hypothetical protein
MPRQMPPERHVPIPVNVVDGVVARECILIENRGRDTLERTGDLVESGEPAPLRKISFTANSKEECAYLRIIKSCAEII